VSYFKTYWETEAYEHTYGHDSKVIQYLYILKAINVSLHISDNSTRVFAPIIPLSVCVCSTQEECF